MLFRSFLSIFFETLVCPAKSKRVDVGVMYVTLSVTWVRRIGHYEEVQMTSASPHAFNCFATYRGLHQELSLSVHRSTLILS